MMAHTYSHLFGIPSTGLRFFTVYGPWGRPDMALFLFTKAILAGEPVNVFNHGKMQRDFTYIDDIVEGVVRVLDRAPQPNPRSTPRHRIRRTHGRHTRCSTSATTGRRDCLSTSSAGRSARSEGRTELPADAARRCAGDVCGHDAANGVDRAQARDTDPRGDRAVRRLVRAIPRSVRHGLMRAARTAGYGIDTFVYTSSVLVFRLRATWRRPRRCSSLAVARPSGFRERFGWTRIPSLSIGPKRGGVADRRGISCQGHNPRRLEDRGPPPAPTGLP